MVRAWSRLCLRISRPDRAFQALGIKAGEQHIIGRQKVYLASLEILNPIFAFFLAADIMQDQRSICVVPESGSPR